MESCTVTRNLEIVPGTRDDYELLSQYHYRQCLIGPYAAIYVAKRNPGFRSAAESRLAGRDAMKGNFRTTEKLKTVGVIVYSMPAAGCRMRSNALEFLTGLDRVTRLKLINQNIRTISRVIIEPRFRSLGLAARLVRETMPLMNVPFIEALAVMGQVNPFFEKAGMTRINAPVSVSVIRLIEALDSIGVIQQDLINPNIVCAKLEKINSDFIESEITMFLQSYGKRRWMKSGIERTKFILSKLTDSSVYYFWKNPGLDWKI